MVTQKYAHFYVQSVRRLRWLLLKRMELDLPAHGQFASWLMTGRDEVRIFLFHLEAIRLHHQTGV